jgi:hypothetical protein
MKNASQFGSPLGMGSDRVHGFRGLRSILAPNGAIVQIATSRIKNIQTIS